MHYLHIGLWWAAEILVSILYFSTIEWSLHRYVMHRPLWKFRYPFEKHALIHHKVFKADHTYHSRSKEDEKTIPMAWWNGFVLVTLGTIPIALVRWKFDLWRSVVIWGFIVGAAYYGTYEWIHWAMHKPLVKKRLLLETGIQGKVFRLLNGHHLLHHRYMKKNFNVVLPVIDLITGTLLLRSLVKFAQPEGPSVPNVQPREPRKDRPCRSAWISD